MLELRHISKTFFGSGVNHQAVIDVNLKIAKGEFFSLLGPSGCGKTTLLRLLAGFETPTSGEIYSEGTRVDQMSPQQRPFHMVFQRYALFPHLTVFENVAFGLRLKKINEVKIKERVENMLKLVNMQDYAIRLPETLSGGQAQRVAIARAAVNEPQVLLLDEPLSALDQKLREHMQIELKELQQKLKMTFIYVTHDQEEALVLSDRIAVMSKGRVEQVSSPEDLYHRPQTLFTAEFVGSMNKVDGMGFIRPEKIQIQSGGKFAGTVKQKIFRGTQTEMIVDSDHLGTLNILVGDSQIHSEISVGQKISFNIPESELLKL